MEYLIVYFTGWILTLFVLIKWGERLGFGGYDPPHEPYYDDYQSNAHAWVAFSTAWPIFVFFNTLFFIHRKIVETTQKIIDSNG